MSEYKCGEGLEKQRSDRHRDNGDEKERTIVLSCDGII